MASEPQRDAPPLVIEIESGLKRRVEAAAAAHGVSVRDYVAGVLEEAVDLDSGTPAAERTREWSRLSAPAFARDWESDADAVYDELA